MTAPHDPHIVLIVALRTAGADLIQAGGAISEAYVQGATKSVPGLVEDARAALDEARKAILAYGAAETTSATSDGASRDPVRMFGAAALEFGAPAVIEAIRGATHAFQSYAHGNTAPELAIAYAAKLESIVAAAEGLRAGDTVLHRPSGELWIVAAALEGDRLRSLSGQEAPMAHCSLQRRCTDAEHRRALETLALAEAGSE